MAAIAGGTGCSAGLVFKNKESSCSNGVSVLQFNGIRAVENKQVGSSGFKPNGFISTSGSKFRRIKAISSPTVSAPKRETDPKKRIVITGMGIVSVFGNDIDTFYNKLLEGESGITPIDRFDATAFSVRIAGQIHNFSCEGYINGKNDRRLDDCWRYCLVAGKKALVDAKLGPEVLETMDKLKIGVLVGSSLGGLTAFSSGVEALIQSGHKKMSPFLVPYTITNMGSALLAIDTGLMGPSYCISTACATANHCFFAAAGHIRRGEANIMVAGATEAAVTPVGVGGFIACRALSQRNSEPHKASRPWDKERDGFVLGEGSGVLIMESLEHATKRGANIIAEYLGGAVTCDAYHMTDPRKDGLGVSSCVRRALEEAGVSPEEVNYVNAHATSTPAGDLAEVNALKKVFKYTSEMKMNGTKSMIGHAGGAAGGLEAIATIKAINTGWLHPTINQCNLESDVTIDTVPNVKKEHEVYVAISNSFGFGGHNAVVVFAPFKP
ncbi:3-oxoacyl-[acyl-carrier-protein] synthase I, chloroplastic-like [Rhododendron vialii]|uniref:3-oxoacyl-[acyl-carrier-protein] synthase I, chloroplastic-like n=1 Tax=Rhododendron vialii TaxID=182163 RepID=UPI00265F10B2|nr:3-oxoacyl-[acyl-carrier-protein] synthase I, chloroplastic-like [Rhododendron vialii]